MASSYKVEILPSPACVLGEGPHWDIERQSLYFVDIYGGKNGSLHRYDYAENKIYSASIDQERIVSFIIPVEGTTDEFAVGLTRRIGIVRWDGLAANATLLRIEFEIEPEEMYKTNRLNDGKADPRGRLFSGTMRLEELGDVYETDSGSFYRYSDQQVTKLKSNIGASNGLTWNEKIGKFYYIDTIANDVKQYDYDFSTGTPSNESVLIDFACNDGERPSFGPDGMTIDADGFLYVAIWCGSKVLRIDPTSGKIVQEIKLPAEEITSVAFGGPNLDILYVTSAKHTRDVPQPLPAGNLFKITGLGVKGLPMQKVRF